MHTQVGTRVSGREVLCVAGGCAWHEMFRQQHRVPLKKVSALCEALQIV